MIDDLKHWRLTPIPPNPEWPVNPNMPKWLNFTNSIEWMFFEQCFVHSMPIINSTIELIFTNMVFLKRDAKYVFLGGFIYIFANYWGYDITKSPVYDIHIPGFDFSWRNKFETFYTYLLQAVVLYILCYIIAIITQKIDGFKEG